jgi:hypothetical protein
MRLKKVPIRYTSRDFVSIKTDLLEYVKRYYPDTLQDFREASFGSLMLDTVSYVGDNLSFYIDYQANESFLNTATETENVIRLARQFGYKYQARSSTFGAVALFILIPATSYGTPDLTYAPILEKGSTFTSLNGETFSLLDDVNFSDTNNPIVVARVDSSTGVPTKYAIRAFGNVVSGDLAVLSFTIGEFKKFRRLSLDSQDVVEIISITDSEGHEYYEVENLAQDVIYKDIKNTGDDQDLVKNVLKVVPVPRRFVIERTSTNTYIQFGFGSDQELQIHSNTFEDPSKVVLQLNTRDYVSDVSFDPTDLIKTDKFGVGPSNTTITVRFRKLSANNGNIPANSLTTPRSISFRFNDILTLNSSNVTQTRGSLEVNNPQPFVGEINYASVDEIKTRTLAYYASQNRAVSKQDYLALIYAMPTKYGSIKRTNVIQDPQSRKRNLNIYVISENTNSQLMATNATVKNNLKTWLSNYKLINDTIDIYDAKIINLGLKFVVKADVGVDKAELLNNCLNELIKKFNFKQEIGEDFDISAIYQTLNKIEGVVDTVNVEIVNKTGGLYSSLYYDVISNTTADGLRAKCPLNVVFELKYPTSDITGTII